MSLVLAIRSAAVAAIIAGAGVTTASAALIDDLQANGTYCPGTGSTTDREFVLGDATGDGTGISCFASGVGNINGNNDAVMQMISGLALIDKSDDTTSGLQPNALSGGLTSGTFGTWSFVLPDAGAGMAWVDVILGLKSGQGQLDPDWAAFKLPDGLISGTWYISGQQALSHANLYARKIERPDEPNVVPLPASALLLLGGMAGLGALRKLRRKPAV